MTERNSVVPWSKCAWQPTPSIDVEALKAALRARWVLNDDAVAKQALDLIVRLQTHQHEAFAQIHAGNKPAALRLLRCIRHIWPSESA